MIEKSDVGAWVIKGNPEIWDYFGAVADDTRQPDSKGLFSEQWTISNNYRKDLMEPGDLMVLWITGTRDPGIYELGRLTSHAQPGQGFDLEYALDLTKARAENHFVDYECVRLDEPIPRAALKNDPVLQHCEQIRAPQGANPSYFKPEEVAALRALAQGHVKKSALKAAGWS